MCVNLRLVIVYTDAQKWKLCWNRSEDKTAVRGFICDSFMDSFEVGISGNTSNFEEY